MAYKTFKLPLTFSQSGILALVFLLAISPQLSLAMKKKPDVHPDVSFVSSTQDWSKDLENIKPYGPTANAASMDPVTGYQTYRTLRFKIIRKLISVGPNLWNTICHYAELAQPSFTLEAFDGYGPKTSSSCLAMDDSEKENRALCDQRSLNVVYEILLPGPFLDMLLALLLPELANAVTQYSGYIIVKFIKDLDDLFYNKSRSNMLMAQSDWLSARWMAHMDLSQAYMQWRQLLATHCRLNKCPRPDPENTLDQLMLFLADVNPRCPADGHEYFRNIISLYNMRGCSK